MALFAQRGLPLTLAEQVALECAALAPSDVRNLAAGLRRAPQLQQAIRDGTVSVADFVAMDIDALASPAQQEERRQVRQNARRAVVVDPNAEAFEIECEACGRADARASFVQCAQGKDFLLHSLWVQRCWCECGHAWVRTGRYGAAGWE